jgi:hypothetical protein
MKNEELNSNFILKSKKILTDSTKCPRKINKLNEFGNKVICNDKRLSNSNVKNRHKCIQEIFPNININIKHPAYKIEDPNWCPDIDLNESDELNSSYNIKHHHIYNIKEIPANLYEFKKHTDVSSSDNSSRCSNYDHQELYHLYKPLGRLNILY